MRRALSKRQKVYMQTQTHLWPSALPIRDWPIILSRRSRFWNLLGFIFLPFSAFSVGPRGDHGATVPKGWKTCVTFPSNSAGGTTRWLQALPPKILTPRFLVFALLEHPVAGLVRTTYDY